MRPFSPATSAAADRGASTVVATASKRGTRVFRIPAHASMGHLAHRPTLAPGAIPLQQMPLPADCSGGPPPRPVASAEPMGLRVGIARKRGHDAGRKGRLALVDSYRCKSPSLDCDGARSARSSNPNVRAAPRSPRCAEIESASERALQILASRRVFRPASRHARRMRWHGACSSPLHGAELSPR